MKTTTQLRILAFALCGGLALACSHQPPSTAAQTVQGSAPSRHSESEGDCHRVESERFVFHSDPWINLHNFLFEWARNVPQRQPGDRGRPVDVVEHTQLESLAEGDRQAWERAVGYYREHLIAKNLLSDRDLMDLRGKLAPLACSESGPEGIDAELRAALEGAMRIYRQRWWPQHHEANMAWIRERAKQLKTYESRLSERLAQAYGGEWPAERLRVDVTAYASWSGGYTTNNPNHITLSGKSYKGSVEGLEVLFHEASHTTAFEQKLLGQLDAAFRQRGAEMPGRLFHTIQFVTPPELIRSLLSAGELSGYRSVAEGVYERGPSLDEYRLVLKHWKPFLDGKIQRAEALDRIAAELAPKQAE